MLPFKIEPDISFIYSQLINHGYEAYYVGGCVRDSLMGTHPHDYDVTTSASPSEIMACFDERFKVIPTGLKHGTITVLYQNQTVEITTFRAQEVYENHRAPSSLIFTRSLSEDLKRRDFTINAMAYAPNIGLIDEHQGAEDLKKGLVRCVGNPEQRFKEDALRILRCVRFAHRFGFRIEENTQKALINRLCDLHYISIERITNEFFSMLTDGKPNLLLLLSQLGLLEKLLPQYHNLNDDEIKKLSSLLDQTPDKLSLKLAILLMPIKEYAENILKQWKTSNQLSNYVLSLIAAVQKPINNHYDLKKCLYEHHNDLEWMKEVFMLKQLLFHEEQPLSAYLKQLKEEDLIERRKLAINGTDCSMLGYQGKEISESINKIIDAILKDELKNERETLLKYLKYNKK